MQTLIDKLTAHGYIKRPDGYYRPDDIAYQKEFADGHGTLFYTTFLLSPYSTEEDPYANLMCRFALTPPLISLQISGRALTIDSDLSQLERTLLDMWYAGKFEYIPVVKKGPPQFVA